MNTLTPLQRLGYFLACRMTDCYYCRLAHGSVMIKDINSVELDVIDKNIEWIKFCQGQSVHAECQKLMSVIIRIWERRNPGKTLNLAPCTILSTPTVDLESSSDSDE